MATAVSRLVDGKQILNGIGSGIVLAASNKQLSIGKKSQAPQKKHFAPAKKECAPGGNFQ
jgi:hypothetical protein